MSESGHAGWQKLFFQVQPSLPIAPPEQVKGTRQEFSDVDRNFIGVDRNFIGTRSLRYCYVVGGRSGLDRGCTIYGAPPFGIGILLGALWIAYRVFDESLKTLPRVPRSKVKGFKLGKVYYGRRGRGPWHT